MATLRHASDFFLVEVDRPRRRVIITRLERLFASALEAEEACRPVIDVLGPIDRRDYVLVTDVRRAYAPFRRQISGAGRPGSRRGGRCGARR